MSEEWWGQEAKISEYFVQLLVAKQEPRFPGVAARIALKLVWKATDDAKAGNAASLDFYDVSDSEVPATTRSEGMVRVNYPFRRYQEIKNFLDTAKPEFVLGYVRESGAPSKIRVTLVGPRTPLD